MTADLREKCHFSAFHIFAFFSPKSANMHISRVLWSTGGDFHHFLRLFIKTKNLKIFMTADLLEKCHFWAFHIFAYFSPKSANMHISRVLWSTGGDFHHFKRLSRKSKKFEDFHDRRPARKMSFFGISHFCIFLTQISKYAHFKGPVVNWWWFSSFLKAFQKVEKFEHFHDRGPAKNCHFWAFHIFAYFPPKSANMHISRVLGSTGGDFHHFKRLSRKSKNLMIFMTADLREKCHFWAFHIFAYFSPKSANMHISRVLLSTGGGFDHF